MASPFVRPAELGDAPALGELHYWVWQEAYVDVLPAEALARASIEARTEVWTRVLSASTDGTFVVDTSEGQLAGLVTCEPSRDDNALPTTGEVLAFYVRQQWWARDVAAR